MVTAVVSLTGLGLVAAYGLSLASKKFHVEVDPRLETIEGILPGLNCGACGYAGCPGFAVGLLEGEAVPTACAPGGEGVISELAEFLGLEVGDVIKQVAVLHCGGGTGKAVIEAQYDGVQDCRAALLIGGGSKLCRYSCVGYGTCEAVCPFDAIAIGPEGLPVVIPEKCTACNKCVVACPRNILSLEPASHVVRVECHSIDPGGRVRKVCQVGCTGCGICEKACPVEAITVDENLAFISPDKCVECGICAANCPQDTILDGMQPRAPVFITEKCNGCTICAKVCPYDAIEGQAKELHVVDEGRCVGCRLCVDRCNVSAIVVQGEEKAVAAAN